MPVFRGKKLGGKAWLVTPGAVQPTPPPDPPPTGTVLGNTTATLGSSTSFDKNRVFNRDVYTGNPAGFTTGFGKGWGAVPITVTPSAAVSTGMWVRLHDAADAAAVSTTVGTGAVIQPPVALPGIVNLTTGVNSLNMVIPAGLAWYYADLSLNSAMTNAVRIPIPFGVGAVFMEGPNTSHGGGFLGPWAYSDAACTMIEAMVDISPYGVCLTVTPAGSATLTGADLTTWRVPGNNGNSPYHTSFAAEFLRLSIQRLGVNCALIGVGRTGGFSRDYQGPYDTTNLGHNYAVLRVFSAKAGDKMEALIGLLGANDAVEYGTRTQTAKNLQSAYAGLQAVNAVPNIGVVLASSPMVDFAAGSSTVRQQQLAQHDIEVSLPNTVNNEWFDVGFNNVGGHTTMLARMRMARQYYRLTMGLMGTAKGGFALRRGPKIVSGTRVGTTITLTVQHDGGTALVKKAWDDANPFTATALTEYTPEDDTAALTWLWSVFPAGKEFPYAAGDPSVLPLATTGAKVQVVNATTINLFLATDPGPSVALDVYYGMDFSASGASDPLMMQMLFDDTTDGDGLTYGRPLRRTLAPIYVAPPSPTVQDLTFGTMLNPVPGGWLFVNGSGTGLSLSDGDMAAIAGTSTKIEVSVNGSAYAVPAGLRILNNNDWSGLVKLPNTLGIKSISARRVGQTTADATASVTAVSARSELPDPDGTQALRAAAVVSYDALNAGTMWQDLAKTIPAAHGQPIRVWQDALGTPSNDLVQKLTGGFPPWLDMHKRAMGNRSVTAERPYVQFGQNVGPDHVSGSRLQADGCAFAGLLGADFTIFAVVDGVNNNWFCISTNGTPVWNWGPEILPSAGGGKQYRRRSGGAPTNGTGLVTVANPPPNQFALDYVTLRYDNSTGTLTAQNRSATISTATDPAKPVFTAMNTFWLGGTVEGPVTAALARVHQFTCFNRVLTDTEVAALNTYAAAKWPW